MIISIIRLDQYFTKRVQYFRNKYDNYKICPHLKSYYISIKDAVLEKVFTVEELFE